MTTTINDCYLKDLTISLESSPKHIQVAHLNICSLRNIVDEMRILQRLCKFDIIAITETHLDTTVRDVDLHIDGLKLLRKGRAGHRDGGCVMYFAEHLRAIQRKDLTDKDIEAIFIELRFPCNSALFSVVYRPPDCQEFL